MSSMKVKLLVLSQITKKVIFISHLLNALTLKINKSLIIKCNNKQTFRLITENFMKLFMKL